MAYSKLFRTGEAARYLRISPQTLRNYQYRGILIPVIQRKTGHRLYSYEQLVGFKKSCSKRDKEE